MGDKGENDMNSLVSKQFNPLDSKKKALLKKFIGKNSSEIDFNKVRDSWKYDKD